MKQHIKKEQWDELSDEQKRLFYNLKENQSLYVAYYPSIGQMIEFLGDDLMLMELQPEGHWRIDYKTKKREIMQTKLELADALFEAVKEKLNK